MGLCLGRARWYAQSVGCQVTLPVLELSTSSGWPVACFSLMQAGNAARSNAPLSHVRSCFKQCCRMMIIKCTALQ